MKKIMMILVAIFIASSVSFGQVNVSTLDYAQQDSTWSKDVVSLWNTYSAVNPYGKEMKIADVAGEDLVSIYHITGITKSRKMIKDSTGTKVAEHPDQWMIVYKKDGKIIAFVTYDDPTNDGNLDDDAIAEIMSAGLHHGDDEQTTAYSSSDAKFAPKEENNVEIPDDF